MYKYDYSYSGKKRKAYQTYSEESVEAALVAIRNGSMGLRVAAQHFQVPKSTLSDYIHGKTSRDSQTRGQPAYLDADQEKNLVAYVKWMCLNGTGLTRKCVRDTFYT